MSGHLKVNPWTQRFEELLDRDELKRRITRLASPLAGLEEMPIEVAKHMLEKGMRDIYVPSEQALEIMSKLIEMALAHGIEKYPSPEIFLRGMYADSLPLEPGFATCVTGLAGVGKSQMLRELRRVIGLGQTVDIDAHHKAFPLIPLLYVEQRAKSGTAEVLRALLSLLGIPENPKKSSIDRLVRELRRRGFNAGTCLLICDEVQMASLSATANASVTHQLLTLRDTGFPFVSALNFSLLHRLKLRPSEDQQRLLSDVHVLHSPAPTSQSFIELLDQYKAVAPTAFKLDLVVHAERIHIMTAGLPRLIILLFKCAYGIARKDKALGISITHLEQAYRSTQFSQNREEVDAIERFRVNPHSIVKIDGKARFDLCCPFRESASDGAEIKAARDRAERETAEKVLVSSLSAGEMKELQAYEKRENVVVIPPPTLKARRPPVHRPKSGEQLLANLGALEAPQKNRGRG